VLTYDTSVVNYLRSPRLATLALPTMAPNPTSDLPPIFEDGELKPGIYKIQNIYSETFLDIHVHSREVCCRPLQDLGEERGLVSQYPLSVLMYLTVGSGRLKSLGVDIRFRW